MTTWTYTCRRARSYCFVIGPRDTDADATLYSRSIEWCGVEYCRDGGGGVVLLEISRGLLLDFRDFPIHAYVTTRAGAVFFHVRFLLACVFASFFFSPFVFFSFFPKRATSCKKIQGFSSKSEFIIKSKLGNSTRPVFFFQDFWVSRFQSVAYLSNIYSRKWWKKFNKSRGFNWWYSNINLILSQIIIVTAKFAVRHNFTAPQS